MSERTRRQLEIAALVIAVFSSVSGWFVYPYRITTLENTQKENQIHNEVQFAALIANRSGDREILVIIKERLESLQRAFDALQQQNQNQNQQSQQNQSQQRDNRNQSQPQFKMKNAE